MKLSKEELINKLTNAELEDSLKIELLEDVADSMDESVDMSQYVGIEDYNKAVSDLEELKTRYIARFGESSGEDKPKDEIEDDRVIEVKEV